MAAKHVPSEEEGGTDWRRLATDRNVSHGVASALWQRARATAPDDPMQAEHEFHRMLETAAAANVTHEPGRETLVDSTPGARDASSLGAGKWTRVLLEEQKPGGRAGSAKRGTERAAQAPAERETETGEQPSAEELRNKLVAAGQASKTAAALLAASDPATIVEALRELRDSEGPGLLQGIMSVAGGVIERILAPAPAHGTPDPAAANRTPAANTPAANTPAANTPAANTPVPATANRTPAANTPAANTPVPATANRTPAANTPDPAKAAETTRPSRSSRS